MRAIELELSRLKQGEHVCVYYESAGEQLPIVTAYIKQGLARRERCLYVADDRIVKEVCDALGRAGVDVEKQRLRGALDLRSARDAHVRNGRFDCEAMLALLNDAVEQALEDGFTGLRAAGEMTWILAGVPGTDRAMEYEALMNEFYPRNHALGMCLYHRSRMPPRLLNEALQTHPRVLTRGRLEANPYYEPPDVYFGRATERAQFDLRLAHLSPVEKTRGKTRVARRRLR